jgi:predicted phosphoribosyltransferase
MFRDRQEAGRLLGEHLRSRIEPPAVVLAIPRGGVVVAAPVATALGAPFDIIVPRKIGAPGEPELAVGAVAQAGDEELALFDESSVARLMIPQDYLRAEVERQKREIERRVAAYRGSRPPVPLAGKTVVIVDDGIATGLTARAAAKAVALESPREVVVAAPVAPAETVKVFGREGIRLEVLATPPLFMAVGQFYDDFHAVTDDEVRAVLGAST